MHTLVAKVRYQELRVVASPRGRRHSAPPLAATPHAPPAGDPAPSNSGVGVEPRLSCSGVLGSPGGTDTEVGRPSYAAGALFGPSLWTCLMQAWTPAYDSFLYGIRSSTQEREGHISEIGT